MRRLLRLSSFTADEKAKFQLKLAWHNFLNENILNLDKKKRKNYKTRSLK